MARGNVFYPFSRYPSVVQNSWQDVMYSTPSLDTTVWSRTHGKRLCILPLLKIPQCGPGVEQMYSTLLKIPLRKIPQCGPGLLKRGNVFYPFSRYHSVVQDSWQEVMYSTPSLDTTVWSRTHGKRLCILPLLKIPQCGPGLMARCNVFYPFSRYHSVVQDSWQEVMYSTPSQDTTVWSRTHGKR